MRTSFKTKQSHSHLNYSLSRKTVNTRENFINQKLQSDLVACGKTVDLKWSISIESSCDLGDEKCCVIHNPFCRTTCMHNLFGRSSTMIFQYLQYMAVKTFPGITAKLYLYSYSIKLWICV